MEDFLRETLPAFVGGMGFAGEKELNRFARIVEDARQAFGVVEDECAALVGGEATGEANRQRVGTEGGARGDDLLERRVSAEELIGEALASEADQLAAERLLRFPQ